MTSHTEAREDVAREIVLGAGVEPMAVARAILARLGELGYGDIDQMGRIATSEHFADMHKFKERLTSEDAVEAAVNALDDNAVCDTINGVDFLRWTPESVQAAIAAAIAKAGE